MARPYYNRGEGWRKKNRSPFSRFTGPVDRNVPGPFAGVGPRGYRRSDERILEDVCERLKEHGRIDASKIRVDVKNGVVTLEGLVRDRRTKLLVEQTVDTVGAVRDINNRLRLSSLPGERDEHRYGQSSASTQRKQKGGALVFETNGDSHE